VIEAARADHAEPLARLLHQVLRDRDVDQRGVDIQVPQVVMLTPARAGRVKAVLATTVRLGPYTTEHDGSIIYAET